MGLVSVDQRLAVEVVSTEDFREVLKKEVARIILIILVRFITGYC